MKKLFLILCACGVLSACTSYEPDLDKAKATRDEHLAANRMENGCTFTDEHKALRDCVIKTYQKGSPKTYVPSRLEDGRSVAILRNESTSSYDKETDTYKTERVVVIETVETIGDDAPTVTTKSVETEPVEVKKTEPAKEVKKVEPPKPVVKKVPEKEKTWWDQYEKNRPDPKTLKKVKCPCADPNEPCPQCIDK